MILTFGVHPFASESEHPACQGPSLEEERERLGWSCFVWKHARLNCSFGSGPRSCFVSSKASLQDMAQPMLSPWRRHERQGVQHARRIQKASFGKKLPRPRH